MSSIVMIGVPHSGTLGKAAVSVLADAGYEVRHARADHAFEDLGLILENNPVNLVFLGEEVPLTEIRRLVTHFKDRIPNGFAFASSEPHNPNGGKLIDAGCFVEFWPPNPAQYLDIATRYSPVSPS